METATRVQKDDDVVDPISCSEMEIKVVERVETVEPRGWRVVGGWLIKE